MSLKRRVTIGTIWSATANWGREIVNFVIFFVLARLLGPEAYGLLGMAMIVVAFTQIFIVESVGEALIQRKDLEPGHLDAVFWLLLGMAVLLMLISFAAADMVGALFGQPTVADLVRWLSVLPVLSALSAVPIAQLSREMKFGVLAARSTLAVIGGGIVGITMAAQGYGVWSLVGLQISQKLIDALVLLIAGGWLPGLKASWRHVHDLRSYGAQMIGIRSVTFLEGQSARLIIGYFLGPAALGFYAISWRILEILTQLLIVPLCRVALPAFSQMQNDPGRLQTVLFSGTQMSTLIALPSCLGIAVVAPELIPTVFGDKWVPAVPVIQLFTLLGIQFSISYFINILLRALGRPGLVLKLNLFSVLINTVLLVVVSRFGLIAIAVVIIARCYLLMPLYLYALNRVARINLAKQFRLYLPMLVSALFMVVAVSVWRQAMADELPTDLLLASSILLGIVAYGGAILVTARPLVRQVLGLLLLVRRPSDGAQG